MLEIVEHPSAGYKPRTLHNAQQADATIAFAVDFSTAGEKLTRKAAGDKYLAVPLGTDTLDAARSIFRFLRERHAGVLNIAGNGIYALSSHEWTQWACNAYIHFIISKVHEHRPIGQILTGGQTGVDLAGAVAGF